MDAAKGGRRGDQPQAHAKKDEQWSDLKGIVPEHLMPQGALPEEPPAMPDLPDLPDTSALSGEDGAAQRSTAILGWLREKFPTEDVTRLAAYYGKGYSADFYSCIENGGWGRGVDAALNEEAVQESVQRALGNGLVEYVWRSAMDERVCPRCAANNGKTFRYDTTPPGGYPGLAAGCRCWAEPVASRRKKRQTGKGKGGFGCLLPVLLMLLAGSMLAVALI